MSSIIIYLATGDSSPDRFISLSRQYGIYDTNALLLMFTVSYSYRWYDMTKARVL